MYLQVFKNESAETDLAPVTTLEEGEYLIGRGALLNCNDSRVSKRHGILHVFSDHVTLTLKHENPSFLLPAEGGSITVLHKDRSVPLKDGDKFSLLADEYWYKVRLFKIDNKIVTNTLSNVWLSDSSSQTIKSEILDRTVTEIEVNERNCRSGPDGGISESQNTHIKREPEAENETETYKRPRTEDVENEVSIKQEVSDKEDDPGTIAETISKNIPCSSMDLPSTAGTSGGSSQQTKIWRDRCWYGIRCYRKNAQHRVQWSHPGDADYESDPEDNRPMCVFGADCYRRNPTHRKEYKHPQKNGLLRRLRKKRTPPKKDGNATSNDESDTDNYDLDDPFIDDATEDEYEYESTSSDESDSELGDLLKGDEDEDTRRLLKGAKRFTRNKKLP